MLILEVALGIVLSVFLLAALSNEETAGCGCLVIIILLLCLILI